MAVYNHKKIRSKSTQDSDEGTVGSKVMLKLGGTTVIPKYENAPEYFEGYWGDVEGQLNQSPYGRHLNNPPTSKKGLLHNENKALHWTFLVAFKGTNAEHVVTFPHKNYEESGYHTEKQHTKYFRSDDSIAEIQRQICTKLSILKYRKE